MSIVRTFSELKIAKTPEKCQKREDEPLPLEVIDLLLCLKGSVVEGLTG